MQRSDYGMGQAVVGIIAQLQTLFLQIMFLILNQTNRLMKNNNKYNEFCTEIGVYNNQLVAILCPLNSSGQKIIVEDYPYSFLNELEGDLNLVETEQYTLVKNAVLSKELRTIDDSSDMYWPVSGKPMMEQDKAVEAIESWRNEGLTWFYRECSEFKGERIFKSSMCLRRILILQNRDLPIWFVHLD